MQPVLLSYTDVRCKKQGQAWGQEKSRGRYSEDGYKKSDRMETRQSEGTLEQPPSLEIVAKKIDFENLPLLSRAPTVSFEYICDMCASLCILRFSL